jgi:molecular chaperone IbpA
LTPGWLLFEPLRKGNSVPKSRLRRPSGCASQVWPSGGPSACRFRRICHANFRSCSPLSFHRRLRAVESAPTYPPYNIERTGENAYRISIAVAGFSENDLTIEAKENTLTIRGEKQEKGEENKGEVLYQGIAARAFERRFQLADYVQVTGAQLANGLLHVDLVREIPEAKKPRQIPIGNGKAKAEVLEAKVAA